MVFNEPEQKQKHESAYDAPTEREIRVVVSDPQSSSSEQHPQGSDTKSSKPRIKTERIGDLLRETRLERGDDLYLIAEYLCIKPSFLIALENSRYDEFPADAYIIGFLRTYANFLGIDGKAAIDRYRYEMAGRRKKPVLAMPAPVSEGRAPSPIVMVGATIVLILIYTLWYNISSPNRAEVHTAPPLPTAVQPVPGAETNAAAGLTAPVSPSAAPTNSTPSTTVAPPPSAPGPTPPTASEKPEAKAQSSDSRSSDLVIPPASPGIVVTAGGSPAKNSFLDDPKAKADADKIEKKALADASKDERKLQAETKKIEAEAAKKAADAEKTADANKKAEAEAEAKAKLDKSSDDKSRIVIKATENSWVMIVDDSGKTILDKVLRPGDTFRVPNTPGLSMTTGNGNGISVLLDGKETPKVSTGAPHVVRNIALDPGSLLNPKAE
ncbi:MAG: DUF4115 domain-containing protein [Alphaproteobacteria bacterium]|nr:DUF4115 domain-containing protein [Alphaproteobacteria bacterium]